MTAARSLSAARSGRGARQGKTGKRKGVRLFGRDETPTEVLQDAEAQPSATAASDGEALPRTGLPALALAAIGTFLLGGGAALRRHA